jgi:hypothetical protein
VNEQAAGSAAVTSTNMSHTINEDNDDMKAEAQNDWDRPEMSRAHHLEIEEDDGGFATR